MEATFTSQQRVRIVGSGYYGGRTGTVTAPARHPGEAVMVRIDGEGLAFHFRADQLEPLAR